MRRWGGWALCIASVVHPLDGWAADYFVQGPDHADRARVELQHEVASTAGHPGRVVRRLAPGAGWVYTLRLEGFTTQDAAEEAAMAVASELDVSLSVYATEGAIARTVRVVPSGSTEAQIDLPAIARTHAAGEPGLDPTGPVRFRFRRTLPDGTVVDHTYTRGPLGEHLEVVPVEGRAVASRALVTEGGAWLATDGPYAPQDRDRTRAMVRSFAPEAVLPFVLALPRAAAAGSLPAVSSTAGRVRIDDEAAGGPLELEVGPAPEEIASQGGRVVRILHQPASARSLSFGGYAPVAGVGLVPHTVEVVREGVPHASVRVVELTVQPDVSAGLFTPDTEPAAVP